MWVRWDTTTWLICLCYLLPLELQQRFKFLRHSPDVGGAKNAAAQIETAERLKREGKLQPKNLITNDKDSQKLPK